MGRDSNNVSAVFIFVLLMILGGLVAVSGKADAAVAASATLISSSNASRSVPAVAVEVEPNEIIGLVVCEVVNHTKCAHRASAFTFEEYTFLDYVKMKTGSQRARIIGMQFDPRDDDLYLYFAIPQ